MKSVIKILYLPFLALVAFLWIPLEGFTSQHQTEARSLRAFLSMPLGDNEAAFMRLGSSSNIIVRVAGKTVLFDPATLDEEELNILNKNGVDLAVYTHGHYDHFSSSTALKLFKGSQPVIAVEPSLSPFLKGDIPDEKLITMASGKSFTNGNITIDALEGKHLGPIMLFRVTINDIKIFHGGDSAYVSLQTMASHLAFVPTGSPSPTCKPDYAFQMVSDVKPQIAVPMHGLDKQNDEFKRMMDSAMPETKVIITKPYVIQKVSIR